LTPASKGWDALGAVSGVGMGKRFMMDSLDLGGAQHSAVRPYLVERTLGVRDPHLNGRGRQGGLAFFATVEGGRATLRPTQSAN